VGRVLVSRTGNVGWTVSWKERCPNIRSLETIKGVTSSKQQHSDHGSRYLLRSV